MVLRILLLLMFLMEGLIAQSDNGKNYSLNNSNSAVLMDDLQDDDEMAYRRKDVGFVFGFGLSSGGDYSETAKSYLTAQGYSVSGFWGFLHFEIGLDWRIKGNFFLYPHIRWMWHRISLQTSFGSSTLSGTDYFNHIFLFGLGGRYLLIDKNGHSLELLADVSSVKPSWDMAGFSPSTDGIQKGVNIGYQYNSGSNIYGIEIGYSLIPIAVTAYSVTSIPYPPYSLVSEKKESKNYGGLVFNLTARFPLLNYAKATE